MAVPPTYADLGKCARDVFTKGYGECFGANGLACLGFYPSPFGRPGLVISQNVDIRGKKRQGFSGSKAVLVCTPERDRLTNCCRQVGALVSCPTVGSSSVYAVVGGSDF